MRASRFRWALPCLLVCTVLRLEAQQSVAERRRVSEIQAGAERGDVRSQFELGVAYLYGGGGLAKDESKGVSWLLKAAEQNSGSAQNELGLCYLNGWGATS